MEVEGVVVGVCLVSQEAGISSQQGLNMEIPPQGLGSQSVKVFTGSAAGLASFSHQPQIKLSLSVPRCLVHAGKAIKERRRP